MDAPDELARVRDIARRLLAQLPRCAECDRRGVAVWLAPGFRPIGLCEVHAAAVPNTARTPWADPADELEAALELASLRE